MNVINLLIDDDDEPDLSSQKQNLSQELNTEQINLWKGIIKFL
jgi:hypothetical protein